LLPTVCVNEALVPLTVCDATFAEKSDDVASSI